MIAVLGTSKCNDDAGAGTFKVDYYLVRFVNFFIHPYSGFKVLKSPVEIMYATQSKLIIFALVQI